MKDAFGRDASGPDAPEPPDPWEHPSAKLFAEDMRTRVIPQLRASAVSLSLIGAHEEVDIRQAAELGASLLLGKPLVLAVLPGAHVPDALAAAAAAIVEAHEDPHITTGRIRDALARLQR